MYFATARDRNRALELLQGDGLVANDPVQTLYVAALGGIEAARGIDHRPGSVSKADELAERLAGGRLPQPPRCLVLAPRKDPMAVRGEGHRENPVCVPLEAANFLASRYIPETCCHVTTPCQPAAVRGEGHSIHRFSMPLKTADILSCRRLPQPRRLALALDEHPLTVRGRRPLCFESGGGLEGDGSRHRSSHPT